MATSKDALVLTIAGLFLTGCSTAITGPTPANSMLQSGAMQPGGPLGHIKFDSRLPEMMRLEPANHKKSGRAQIFVSQFYTGYIGGYPLRNKKNGPPTCKIVGVSYVNGIAADSAGNVYIPQEILLGSVWTGNIAVYAPKCGALIRTLSAPGPMLDAATDGSTVYGVGNGNWNIQIYANGSNYPTGTLSSPGDAFGIGVDSKHDVFLSTYVPNTNWDSEVIEFPQGQNPYTALAATYVSNGDFPGSVMLDNKDNLLVVNPQDDSSIAIYAPPYSQQAGRIGLLGASQFCALGKTDKWLYCTDYQYGSVDVYEYPSGAYSYSFTNGLDASFAPEGMAVSPAQQP